MRSRQEIEEQTQVGVINEYLNSRVMIELLLDIRDLLTKTISQTVKCDSCGSEFIGVHLCPISNTHKIN